MAKYHHAASIILVNKQGKFILQLRDDKPGIRSPGLLTAWGGAVEPGETIIQAAVREMREETNLKPTENDLEFFGKYPRDEKINGAQVVNHVFMLRNVDEAGLQVFEGQGYHVVDPALGTSNKLYTNLTQLLIKDYNSRRR